MSTDQTPPVVKEAKRTAISSLSEWGNSSLPPSLLATLTLALHLKPAQPLPLLFPPVLFFSTYLNLSGFKIDAAGLTAAWSGLYLLLASRRRWSGIAKGKGVLGGVKARIGNRFGARGLVRGAAMGVAAMNVVGGGVAYGFGNRRREREEQGRSE